MLQEIKDLQLNAVLSLLNVISRQKEATFRAPTGSGKTYMMANLMNQLLFDSNIVFIVSSLSKSDLAKQNYEKFKEYEPFFQNLNPYLINSEFTGEQKIFIPDGFNVYVLPRDLYKEGSRIKDSGALFNLLMIMRLSGKRIYLVKDECHIATNNLDDLNSFFTKIVNFSATPKYAPDVQITDDQAVEAKLIKHLAPEATNDEEKKSKFFVDANATIEEAINKYLEIRKEYLEKLKVNPCLIIQISNKDKADEEWARIKKIVDDPSKKIKWMYIVQKEGSTIKGSDTNDSVKKLPLSKWKDYAKSKESTIDVIIFKMVISEGWDIPRACMLYQVRDSKSKQMDEQVIGRVRRNPILLDWENYDETAHELALTSWVWGIVDNRLRKFKKVNVISQYNFEIKTTKLSTIERNSSFDLKEFINNKTGGLNTTSVFDLGKKWLKISSDTAKMCWNYIKSFDDWIKISMCLEEIEKENMAFMENYKESMIEDDPASFPLSSFFEITSCMTEIDNWVWRLNSPDDFEYYFDSEAEKEFAKIIKRLGLKTWGKNFYPNSSIKFEYIMGDKHSSYPDFIIKDNNGFVHIIEVKSVNVGYNQTFDRDEYKKKIESLRKMFVFASKVTKQYFYLPVKTNDSWTIYKSFSGIEEIITKDQFIDFFK